MPAFASSRPLRDPIDPTTLLTAIPALLGFIPERSIIVVAFAPDRGISATMRHDLALGDTGEPTSELSTVLAGLGAITHSYGADEVVAVIADDRYPADDPRYRRVLAIADRHFDAIGGVAAGFVLSAFDPGAAWSVIWCPDGQAWSVDVLDDREGVLDDPQTCPTAIAEAVKSGRRILPRRSEMRAMLEPVPGECSTARPCADCDDRGVVPLGHALSDAHLLDLTIGSVAHGGGPLDCAEVAVLEQAVRRPPVRDAVLALAVTDLREDAESVWRELTRRLTGPGRAGAATLLAHLHYIGGEGAYAGVALDVALESDPDAKLAGLLDTALRAGVRPTMLWEMIDGSYGTARELGVQMPEITRRAAG
ncbi:DUF4192 domain-containing protein [Gordonia rubripertincta]|uniref:DUF4192 domain-containing protein n=1 Tax=Gordonia rubripertincta TaxID=36822 RepID=UPI000B8D9991|nr:DUF4192 domain-containing protein [Gordonia rubripertincta]ASR03624.1 hypothetical protein GCWB2_14165 [Gordonia rubripertincta]